jgi:antitoxin VapB
MVQTHKTKPFKSGNSQAVRLPKGFAYPEGTELEMARDGDVVTLRPAKISMKQMIEELRKLPKPPYIEIRDTEEIPERTGL